MIKKLCCDYCRSPIGRVDLETLSVPVKPDMFLSLHEGWGLPSPFHKSLSWGAMRCPYCHRRPFMVENKITIISDEKSGRMKMINIDKLNIEQTTREENQKKIDLAFAGEPDPGMKLSCPHCGKEYSHQSSLSRHLKTCQGKVNLNG